MTELQKPRHSFKNIKEAKTWAKGNITGIYGNVNTGNVNTGESIIVSKTAIDKYLSEIALKKSVSFDAHLSALLQIPKLIETSVLFSSTQDRLNDPNINEIQRFYGAINYEHEIYPVKLTVKVIVTGEHKAYSYEVMHIETPITTKELSG